MKHAFPRLSLTALLATAGLTAAPAFAATFNPTQDALGFNIFTSGDLNVQGGEVDGAAFAGGNLLLNGLGTFGAHTSGSYPYQLTNIAATPATYKLGKGDQRNVALAISGKVIYGTVNGGNETKVNNGLLRIGNLLPAADPLRTTLRDRDNNNALSNLRAVKANNYASQGVNYIQVQRQQVAYTASNPDRADQKPIAEYSPGVSYASHAFGRFGQIASILNKYTDATPPASCAHQLNKVVLPAGNNPHVPLVSGKVNVLNLTPTALNALYNRGSIIFDTPPSATTPLVINVSNGGNPYSMNFTMFNAGGLNPNVGEYIIWNFYKATSVGINPGNEMYGSVFAPTATISRLGGNNINGQIIAAKLNTGTSGEMHQHPFEPNLPQCDEPLPVELVSFVGDATASGVRLNWLTASEKNVREFQVEASANGRDWTKVGTVNATGDSGSAVSYSFEDARPLSSGVRYYRLKTVDNDESFALSEIIAFSASGDIEIEPTDVYPTEVRPGDRFTIKTHQTLANEVFIRIFDSNGRQVGSRIEMPGVSEVELNSETAVGRYYVEIVSKVVGKRGEETRREVGHLIVK